MISNKKTKIIATIGPSCDQEKILEKLILNGIDAARLNFSHGSHQEKERNIELIRKISKKINKHISIIADIQGPKIRIGNLPEPGIDLKKGEEITIDTGTREFYNNRIPLPSLLFRDGTKEGHQILLDDGTIQAIITKKYGGIFKAIIQQGGTLFSKKGVNVPDLDNNAFILNAKDKADIMFAIKAKADYIAISFIRCGKDLKGVKKFLGKSKIKIIAKIERPEALLNIHEITEEADVIMIARGDLGIETPLWELPIRQKEIIERVRKASKPVIVATQMLDSMIRNSMPTRAEVSDVANAVFDSTDCVMLSGETAFGKHPVESVEMMKKIVESSDNHLDHFCANIDKKLDPRSPLVVAKSALRMATDSNAKAIIVSGKDYDLPTAVSHFRPTMPIIIATDKIELAQSLALVWGVNTIIIKNKKIIDGAKKFIADNNYLKKGDKVVCIHNLHTITTEII